VFAKEVNCANIAYHSKYIASAGPALLKYLREVSYDMYSQISDLFSSSPSSSSSCLPTVEPS
jgi:fatty acid synthase